MWLMAVQGATAAKRPLAQAASVARAVLAERGDPAELAVALVAGPAARPGMELAVDCPTPAARP